MTSRVALLQNGNLHQQTTSKFSIFPFAQQVKQQIIPSLVANGIASRSPANRQPIATNKERKEYKNIFMRENLHTPGHDHTDKTSPSPARDIPLRNKRILSKLFYPVDSSGGNDQTRS